MKIKTLKKGFTLPEVIIAVTMVALIIVTATNLLVSSIRANRSNTNQIIAYSLAEEGIEAMRNIRDGYWLNNVKWTGEESLKSERNILGDEFGSEGYYIVEKKHPAFNQQQCQNEPSIVKGYAPWELSKILSGESDETKLYLKDFGDVKEYSSNPTGSPSGFSRWIYIKPIPYNKYEFSEERNDLKIYVAVTVEWEELSAKKSITIPTILTDWKAGPF
jgi:prepilin-type N-terminal cleavage/methylation domain-containing protein